MLEILFIILNSNLLSGLYADREKQNLKEDAFLVKIIAQNKKHEDYGELFENNDIRFTLIDLEGNVVYDSKNNKNEEFMDNHMEREEVKETFLGKDGFYIRKSKTLGVPLAYYATKFKNDFNEEYIVRTSSEYSNKLKQIRQFSFSLVLFFSILNYIMYFFYKNYLKRDLYNKINRMKIFLEAGEKTKSGYFGNDPWISSFWEILKEWQKRNLDNLEKLDNEKKILSLVLSSVDVFIGLLDKKGRFITKNNSLTYIIDPSSDKVLESVKFIEIIDIIKKSLETNKNIEKEIYISSIQNYFIISVKYIENIDNYLITIKDITQTKRNIEIQKNFISNVGHELKTPLTNIKGYLIALSDAPSNMQEKFLKTIENNVDKLENIIIDFLNISKIESSDILNISSIGVKKLENSLRESLDMILRNKNGSLEFKIDSLNSNGIIESDIEKVMLIMKNLIENGFIYNVSENPKVIVEIEEENSKYKFKISDNGIGIPEEKQNKIFERFYRVDKARTSNVAGTGLGLFIVKTLIENLGGEINVTSHEEKGTIFSFYIPFIK